jgi:tyrosinase
MLPYWDETSEESLALGVPWALTQQKVTLDDDSVIDNPLVSFQLPIGVTDKTSFELQPNLYRKPQGYRTVRYPYSGLVGTAAAKIASDEHNRRFSYEDAVVLLNRNVTAWLNYGSTAPHEPTPTSKSGSIERKFRDCLRAPNYTVFSNNTSASFSSATSSTGVTSLEEPHNDVHLAVGGFDVTEADFEEPINPGPGFESGFIAHSNGDMGENNTAGLDPIFFFHHANVDRMFWLWQKYHSDDSKAQEVIDSYPGTNSVDNQGPTPWVQPGQSLGLDFPLYPFQKGQVAGPYTSKDVLSAEDCGYTYEKGSLDFEIGSPEYNVLMAPQKVFHLHVTGIQRDKYSGSFVMVAYAKRKSTGERIRIGNYSVLSRHNISSCANCLTHIPVFATFLVDRHHVGDDFEYEVDIQHRQGMHRQVDGIQINLVEKDF